MRARTLPSQALLPYEVAVKIHSAGIPKSIS